MIQFEIIFSQALKHYYAKGRSRCIFVVTNFIINQKQRSCELNLYNYG
jgi:hypothetical protein